LSTSAVVVSEFLNSIVNSPLPIEGLACVADFLQLSDSSANKQTVERTPFNGMKSRQNVPPIAELNGIDAEASEFCRVLSLYEAECVNSKHQSALALQMVEKRHSTCVHSSNLSTATSVDSCLSVLPSSQFRDGIVNALNRVMEERDSMHSKLVSAEVLHLFEMDEQRKSLAQHSGTLQAKSDGVTPYSTQVGTNNEGGVALNRQDGHFHGDADSELLSLCQQLAGEISARAAADMEVIRLKESRKMEQELEAAEKSSLRMELSLAREQLQLQNEKLEQALHDARIWRESFEEILQFRKGT
jgi:hypothetical protein